MTHEKFRHICPTKILSNVEISNSCFFVTFFIRRAKTKDFSGISNPPAGIGDGSYCVEYTKYSTFAFSSYKKKNMCLEISLGTCPTVFSCGCMSTVALIFNSTAIWIYFFQPFLSVSISTVTKSP